MILANADVVGPGQVILDINGLLGHRTYIHAGGELGGFTPHRHGELLLQALVEAKINFGCDNLP